MLRAYPTPRIILRVVGTAEMWKPSLPTRSLCSVIEAGNTCKKC